MRVAICDDNAKDASSIRFALMGIEGGMEIDCYDNGKVFLERVKSGVFYDLVFMDIYMGEENGIDIVRSLLVITPATQVIFSTSSTDHAIEAFDVNAAGYLVKPYSEADVIKVFARAGLRRETTEETVLMRSGTDMTLFRVSDVVKIESDSHYTIITVKNGNVSRFHIGYSEAAALFKKGFVEVKRGITVNMAYIERIKASVVYVNDGSSYRLGRQKKDEVIRQFTAFALNKTR